MPNFEFKIDATVVFVVYYGWRCFSFNNNRTFWNDFFEVVPLTFFVWDSRSINTRISPDRDWTSHKMYCIVELRVCGTKLIVKKKQVEVLSRPSETILNRGIRRKEKTKTFVSSQASKIDFSLPVTHEPFNAFRDAAVYDAVILHIAGKRCLFSIS